MNKTAAKWLRRVVDAYRQAGKEVPERVWWLRAEPLAARERTGGTVRMALRDPINRMQELNRAYKNIPKHMFEGDTPRAQRLRELVHYIWTGNNSAGRVSINGLPLWQYTPSDQMRRAMNDYWSDQVLPTRFLTNNYMEGKPRPVFPYDFMRTMVPEYRAEGSAITGRQLAALYRKSPYVVFKGSTDRSPNPDLWRLAGTPKYKEGIWGTPHFQVAAGYARDSIDPLLAILRLSKARYKRLADRMTPHVAGKMSDEEIRATRVLDRILGTSLLKQQAGRSTDWGQLDNYEVRMYPSDIARSNASLWRIKGAVPPLPTAITAGDTGFSNIRGLEDVTFQRLRPTGRQIVKYSLPKMQYW